MAEIPKTKNENPMATPEASPAVKNEIKPESFPVPDLTNQTPPSSQPPVPPANSTQMPAPESEKPKSQVWIWVVGGCLGLVVITLVGLAVLGWLGVRQVKKEIQKYDPTVQGVQSNIDKINKEAEEWQKKSEELRNSLPNAEGIYPDGMNNTDMNKMDGNPTIQE